jgi:hypothetical protein
MQSQITLSQILQLKEHTYSAQVEEEQRMQNQTPMSRFP